MVIKSNAYLIDPKLDLSEGTVFRYDQSNFFNFTISSNKAFGKRLYLNCWTFGLDMVDLYTEDLGEAVAKSKEYISNRLKLMANDVEDFVNDNSKIELVPY